MVEAKLDLSLDIPIMRSGLGPGLRRRTIDGTLQIHIEQDRTAGFLGIESDRHPIDNQFDQGHRDDVRSLDRGIGIEPEPDILRPLTRRQLRLEGCLRESHQHPTAVGKLMNLKGIGDRRYLFQREVRTPRDQGHSRKLGSNKSKALRWCDRETDHRDGGTEFRHPVLARN